ncbi:2-aminoadipate transaminase [compost metagenome]
MKQSPFWRGEQEHEHDIISLAGEGIEKGLYPVKKERIVNMSEVNVETEAGSRKSWLGESAKSRLIEFIIETYSYHERTRIEKHSLLLTTGREEALKLLFDVLVKSGETVLTENPVSPVVLADLIRRQVKIVQVSCDAEGMLPGELRSQLALQKPVLVYITPDYSDTVGTSWSSIRRREIVEITRQAGIWLLSDRSSAEAPFAAESGDSQRGGRSLFEIGSDQRQHVRIAELMSMDGHGIHAGWIRASEPLIQRLKDAREAWGSAEGTCVRWNRADKALIERLKEAREAWGSAGGHSCPEGVPAQMLVRPGFSWPQHAAALNREYASRRAEALAVLAGSRALGAVCQHAAGSGRFLWAELPAGMDSGALLRAARLKGAAFLPGARCYAGAGNPRTLRLSLAEQSRQRLRLGLERICEAAEEFTARWEG